MMQAVEEFESGDKICTIIETKNFCVGSVTWKKITWQSDKGLGYTDQSPCSYLFLFLSVDEV